MAKRRQTDRDVLDIVMANTIQSVGYCFLNIFRATGILTVKQMVNYDNFTQDLKNRWDEKDLTTDDVKDYGYRRYPYIGEFVGSIPFSEMMALGKQNGIHFSVPMTDLKAYLQAAVFVSCVINDMVLKDHYRITREMREEFFNTGLRQNFHLWRSGELSRPLIRKYFLEDYGFDIVKGEYIK